MAEIVGEEHELFRRFVEACRPILAAGYAHAAKESPEEHARIMALIDDQRAIARLCVAWDADRIRIIVDAAGIKADGGQVSFPIFEYRLHRETPPGVH